MLECTEETRALLMDHVSGFLGLLLLARLAHASIWCSSQYTEVSLLRAAL